jgi:arsenate reductase-like glutaredoxin family protein
MDEPVVTLIYHSACSECQMIKEALDKQNVKYRARDMFGAPLAREEVAVLLEGVDVKLFLNPRSTEYRDRRLAEKAPSADLAVELIAREPRLLRCPILIRGDDVFPVIIETDAAVVPPEMWKFLGVEIAAKKPAGKAAAGAHAKPAAPAAPKPAGEAPKPPAPAPAPAAEPPKT